MLLMSIVVPIRLLLLDLLAPTVALWDQAGAIPFLCYLALGCGVD